MKNRIKNIIQWFNPLAGKNRNGTSDVKHFRWSDEKQDFGNYTGIEKIFVTDDCVHCTGCIVICPADAIVVTGSRIELVHSLCNYCRDCLNFCPVNGISDFSG